MLKVYFAKKQYWNRTSNSWETRDPKLYRSYIISLYIDINFQNLKIYFIYQPTSNSYKYSLTPYNSWKEDNRVEIKLEINNVIEKLTSEDKVIREMTYKIIKNEFKKQLKNAK